MNATAIKFDKCTICGEFGLINTHRCPPTYLVSDENSDEEWNDWARIYANDAEEAAEKFSAQRDSSQGEYPSYRIVYVKQDEENSPAVAYNVSCESVPSYRVMLSESTIQKEGETWALK
jgi:hypothetical protein